MTRLVAEEPSGMSRTTTLILLLVVLLGVVGGIFAAFYLGYLSSLWGR